MTKPARNKKEIESIKEKIIDSALEIIIDEGKEKFTMRKIALKMKMSATNLYNYFSNKEEMYLAILIKGYEKLHSVMEEAYKTNTDPAARAKKIMKAYISFGTSNRHYYDIMFTRPAPRYKDYIDTPYEKTARKETELTEKIINLSRKAISELDSFYNKSNAEEKKLDLKLIHMWSLLHGMISLYNSNIITYFSKNPLELYDTLINEIID